mgnify:CR=1 FL=1
MSPTFAGVPSGQVRQIELWRANPEAEAQSATARVGLWALARQEFLVAAGNPKAILLFTAFLPQFVSTDEARPLPHMLMLSAVFMLMTFVVFAAYGLFAASVVLNNITDYGSNFRFVQHVMSMDTTFDGNAAMYRAVTTPLLTKADGTKFGKSEGGNIWQGTGQRQAVERGAPHPGPAALRAQSANPNCAVHAGPSGPHPALPR